VQSLATTLTTLDCTAHRRLDPGLLAVLANRVCSQQSMVVETHLMNKPSMTLVTFEEVVGSSHARDLDETTRTSMPTKSVLIAVVVGCL
jgi:hypothetical protein